MRVSPDAATVCERLAIGGALTEAADEPVECLLHRWLERAGRRVGAAGQEDPLIADLRRFILSFGEHDPECPGFEAQGPMAVEGRSCACGFIPRMNDLLADTAARIAKT